MSETRESISEDLTKLEEKLEEKKHIISALEMAKKERVPKIVP